MLSRVEEIAQARKPGQGRREATQCMHEAAEAYGTPQHTHTNATDPSTFGAAEHEKQAALEHHRQLLQKLRETREKTPTCQLETDDAPQSSSNEVGVEVMPHEGAHLASMGPVDLAKYLCDKGQLTTEQQGPVALLARDMQTAYNIEVARRAKLTDAQLRAEEIGATEHVTLPLKGRRLRLLIYGGGGVRKDQDHQLRAG